MEIVTDLPKMYTMSQVAEILEVSRVPVCLHRFAHIFRELVEGW